MDIQILKEFITLSEKLNFSETAKSHYITQPVLSKHIQQLEENVGVTLFHRSRQSVELTNLGSVFLEDAQLIVATYESALKRMRMAKEKFDSALSLAFLDAASRDFLPTLISGFITKYPSVSLEIFNANIPQTYQMLESREYDLAITIDPLSGSYPEYDKKHLYRDPLCVIVPNNHRLAGRTNVTFDDLKGERQIMASPDLISDYQMFLDSLLKKRGVSISMKKEVTSVEEGFFLVESGYGISIVPRHQRYFASPNLQLIPLDGDECYVDIVFAWKKDNQNPNIQRFLKLVDDLNL